MCLDRPQHTISRLTYFPLSLNLEESLRGQVWTVGKDTKGLRASKSTTMMSDLSLACNKLWDLDLNRLLPGRDYQIDCGVGKKVYGRDVVAEGSLYNWLSEDVLRRPTYSPFCSLLDNYNPHEGSKEVVPSEEKEEQVTVVEEISRTAPIKYLHRMENSRECS